MDPNSSEFKNAVLELRTRARTENAALDEQLESALDANYWRELNPNMTLCGKLPLDLVADTNVAPCVVTQAVQTLSTSGYFQLPALAVGPAFDQMRICFDHTRKSGWPATFVFVYDEFWRAFRGPALVHFLTEALGKGYTQLPYVWGHYVPSNSQGWRPHVDGPSILNKLTVWLALSDATLENGCMYVVRRTAETEKIADCFLEDGKSFQQDDLVKALQYAKALPASAGSYIGWGANVLHWGSVSSDLGPRRLSVSVEFASPHPNPPREELPLVEAGPTASLPSFEMRLHLIAKAIRSYDRFEAGLLRYQALAKQLIRRVGVEGVSPPA